MDAERIMIRHNVCILCECGLCVNATFYFLSFVFDFGKENQIEIIIRTSFGLRNRKHKENRMTSNLSAFELEISNDKNHKENGQKKNCK